jgi:hypothetical protein
MLAGQDAPQAQPAGGRRVLRPEAWRPADRHIRLGVSHPSNDPSRHRVFEVRAVFDDRAEGWVAQVGEQNLNEQRGEWAPLLPDEAWDVFPSPAKCRGHAVTAIVAAVDREAGKPS